MPEPILIVDDNPQNLKLLRVLLSDDPTLEVRTAVDAEEAIELLETYRPKLILMDLQLPGMDGLELTRRLKEDPIHRSVIVVAVTAYAMNGDEEKAIEAGCDGYLKKPIDGQALPGLVARHLGVATSTDAR
jgi:two-component system cell cycle response regulator DivK